MCITDIQTTDEGAVQIGVLAARIVERLKNEVGAGLSAGSLATGSLRAYPLQKPASPPRFSDGIATELDAGLSRLSRPRCRAIARAEVALTLRRDAFSLRSDGIAAEKGAGLFPAVSRAAPTRLLATSDPVRRPIDGMQASTSVAFALGLLPGRISNCSIAAPGPVARGPGETEARGMVIAFIAASTVRRRTNRAAGRRLLP